MGAVALNVYAKHAFVDAQLPYELVNAFLVIYSNLALNLSFIKNTKDGNGNGEDRIHLDDRDREFEDKGGDNKTVRGHFYCMFRLMRTFYNINTQAEEAA